MNNRNSPKFVYGEENPHYVEQGPKAASTGHLISGKNTEQVLHHLREDFLTEREYSSENEALAQLMDREPDEVPDYPSANDGRNIMAEFVKHSISSAYIRENRDLPEYDEIEHRPPVGSDGGRVITDKNGTIRGYGWMDDNGKVTSLVSVEGDFIDMTPDNPDDNVIVDHDDEDEE